MRSVHRAVVSIVSVFSALVLFVVGFYVLGGVCCLCAGMWLADLPERVGRRHGA